MRTIILLLTPLLLSALPAAAPAAEAHDCGLINCEAVKIDLHDEPSLQRGARTFVNYCLSCHSASYMRYNRMARDLGIPEDLVKADMMFVTDKIGEQMKVTMRKDDAKKWFGVAPPDLTLVTRWRTPDWVYTYLRSFYRDDKSATGWNNAVFPHVAMPHVLYELQGEQHAVFKGNEFERLDIVKAGTKKPQEFDRDMRDLTNFLVYLGEPAKLDRYRLGVFVLIFLVVFLVFAYLLKKEYWKDVH